MSYDNDTSRDIKADNPLTPKQDNAWMEAIPLKRNPWDKPSASGVFENPEGDNESSCPHPHQESGSSLVTTTQEEFCYAEGDEGSKYCGDPKRMHCDVLGSAVTTKHLVECMRSHHLIHHPFVATTQEAVCWHCGVVLAYTPRLRCEDCPTECDVESCDELGCSPEANTNQEAVGFLTLAERWETRAKELQASSATSRSNRDTMMGAADALWACARELRASASPTSTVEAVAESHDEIQKAFEALRAMFPSSACSIEHIYRSGFGTSTPDENEPVKIYELRYSIWINTMVRGEAKTLSEAMNAVHEWHKQNAGKQEGWNETTQPLVT